MRNYKLGLVILLLLQIYIPGTAFCLEENGKASIENYSNGVCADVVLLSDPGKNMRVPLSANTIRVKATAANA